VFWLSFLLSLVLTTYPAIALFSPLLKLAWEYKPNEAGALTVIALVCWLCWTLTVAVIASMAFDLGRKSK
jgi:hypothetical protein